MISRAAPLIVLTRFNVAVPFAAEPRHLDLDWLRGRLDLFRHYTLASMTKQTTVPARWLLLSDHATPQDITDALADLIKPWPWIQRCEVKTADPIELRAAISHCQPPLPTQHGVVTARLDSDDIVHPDYCARLLAAIKPVAQRQLIVAPTGYKLAVAGQPAAYRMVENRGPFCALYEPASAEPWHTVMAQNHMVMRQHYAATDLDGGPLWAIVIHDDNAVNQVGGIRWPLARVKQELDLPTSIANDSWTSWLPGMLRTGAATAIDRCKLALRRR